jgi:hypothetical protein
VHIFEDLGTFDNIGLFFIHRWHLEAAALEAMPDLFEDLIFEKELFSERGSDDLPSAVIFGGTESADEKDYVRAVQAAADAIGKIILAVSDDRLEIDFQSQIIHSLGDEQRICVLTVGCEQLITNGDDFYSDVIPEFHISNT